MTRHHAHVRPADGGRWVASCFCGWSAAGISEPSARQLVADHYRRARTLTRLTVATVVAALVGLAITAAVARSGAATAAPTCTAGDLELRQGFQCDMGPGLGVTPGHSCVPYWTGSGWRVETGAGCRR